MMYKNWKMLSVILSDILSKKQIVLEASNIAYVKEPGEFKQYGIHFEKVKRKLEK